MDPAERQIPAKVSTMYRGFRYRLYPTPAQAETLGQWIGVTRLVYNLALEQRRDFGRQYKAAEGRDISFASQGRELTPLRAEFDWIGAVPVKALTSALLDLDKAFKAYRRGISGFPLPRRLGVNDSIRLYGESVRCRPLNAKWSEVRLPCLGWARLRFSRPLRGVIKSVTVTRTADAWFVTFGCEVGEAPTSISPLPGVGIDRGVTNTLSLSTGEHVRLPKMADLAKRLRRHQQILSRRKQGSRRYMKQRRRVARLHGQMARARAHHLHVASTALVRRFGVVALEKLNVRGMTASARGTVEAPGRNVRQKAGLNRSILAQGWTRFATMLDYKLEAAGGRLIYVPAAYTSQTCAECGVVDARSRKSQAAFLCVACGHADHADTNAARNIMRGSTALVEGSELRPPMKRELSRPRRENRLLAGDAERRGR